MHEKRAEPAVAIADLEYELTDWLCDQPCVLYTKLFDVCRGDADLQYIASSVSGMVGWHERFLTGRYLAEEPAVAIADLEYALTARLYRHPHVLSKLVDACRGDEDLERVAFTLARMRALHAEFQIDLRNGDLWTPPEWRA